jgi:hypothetical protein
MVLLCQIPKEMRNPQDSGMPTTTINNNRYVVSVYGGYNTSSTINPTQTTTSPVSGRQFK